MKRKTHLLFLVLTTVLATTAPARPLILMNADFENVEGTKPTSWSSEADHSQDASLVWGWHSESKEAAPEGAVLGDNALKLWAWATSFDLTQERSSARVRPGATYRFKLHYHQDGKPGGEGHLHARVQWYDARARVISESLLVDTEDAITPGGTHTNGDFAGGKAEGWVHCDVVAPKEAVFAGVKLSVGKWVPRKTPYIIDGISLEELTGNARVSGVAKPDPYSRDGLRDFFGRILVHADDYWHDDHWVDHRNKEWIGHSSTLIYHVLAHAALGGDTSRVERIAQHYAWNKQKHWVPRLRCWVNDADVMANACMALNIASGLSVGRDFLSAELRTEMENDLRAVCRWLATRNTAVLNNRDLRAANQDAIAAGALALSSAYFGSDADFRRMALDKVRLILERSEGPFWVEGGVDKAYQIAGESSFALAADLLWDHLQADEKRRIAELFMRPYAAGAMGLEKTRSESSLGAEEEGSTASAILARVVHPLILADVRRNYAERQNPHNPWWIFDTPAVAYYHGIVANAALLASDTPDASQVGWGGQARLAMRIDEAQSHKGSVDQKTFLSSDTGVTALFGDTSGWSDHYALKNRKATARPSQYNPGGLRYVGKERTVSIWAEGRHDFPRLVFGENVESNGTPRLNASHTAPGFTGAQYRLSQSLTDTTGIWVGTVEQLYTVLGEYVIARLETDNRARELPALRYEFTAPLDDAVAKPVADGRMVRWSRGGLHSKDAPTTHAIIGARTGAPVKYVADTLKPFLVNEPIRHWVFENGASSVNIKTDFTLSRVQVPLRTDGAASWFLLASGTTDDAVTQAAATLRTTEQEGVETFSFTDGRREYGIVYLAGKTKRDAGDPVVLNLTVGEIRLERPIMSVFQSFVVENGQLLGFFAQAAGVSLNGRPLVRATDPANPAQTSMLVKQGLVFADVTGGEVLWALGEGKTATSLIDGNPVDLAKPVTNDRFWHAW